MIFFNPTSADAVLLVREDVNGPPIEYAAGPHETVEAPASYADAMRRAGFVPVRDVEHYEELKLALERRPSDEEIELRRLEAEMAEAEAAEKAAAEAEAARLVAEAAATGAPQAEDGDPGAKVPDEPQAAPASTEAPTKNLRSKKAH